MRGRSEPILTVPVLTRARQRKYVVLTAAWVVSALFFWTWWFRPAHVGNPVLFGLTTLSIAWIYVMSAYFLWVFLGARRSNALIPMPREYRVAMIVTKTPSEPWDLVQRTLEAMLAQNYPHDTWLADEDPSEETRAWCAAHGVKISSRKGVAAYHQAAWPRRTRCKEGNLAYFYDHWGYRDYDIVSQLDADHVPQPGYLREMLRPFADPEVGYVSAPSICSANAGASWAARTRLFAESAFHGVLQSGYSGFFAPLCIGSHYAVRTQALQDIGGLGPELAEDHSTTMLMNAGGWRGMHAMNAIAYGDGPANAADLATQEFQWSRSLLTLLLSHTGRYLGRLPPRLRFFFVFCQLWYPIYALNMAFLYAVPLCALSFDVRFAEVSYPAFLGHGLPSGTVMLAFAYALRRDGFFRPLDGKIFAWEKALFMVLQWPWVLWGCTMAVVDRLSGKFVDFRVTPKGAGASGKLPGKVLAVYSCLAAGCIAPVLLVSEASAATGFYLLSLVNGAAYIAVLAVIVVHHRRENPVVRRRQWRESLVNFGLVGSLVMMSLVALDLRGEQSLLVLADGMAPLHLVRPEYIVAGAGLGDPGRYVRFRFDPGWD